MPLEYSVAGFRFGHTLVRNAYDYNRNFGKKNGGPGVLLPVADFDLLFLFTGNGFARDSGDRTKSIPAPFGGQGPTLPFNWVIEWDRFTDKGSADPTHFARKLDTRLVPRLTEMVNEGTKPAMQDDANKPIRLLLRFLAQRNLVRGYLLSLPTGQSVAQAMGVPVLSETELRQNNSDAVNAALEQGRFLQRTPRCVRMATRWVSWAVAWSVRQSSACSSMIEILISTSAVAGIPQRVSNSIMVIRL